MHPDGLEFYPKYGLNAGVLLSRLDRLRRSDFSAVRERIIKEWGPAGRGLLYLGDQACAAPMLGRWTFTGHSRPDSDPDLTSHPDP